MRREETRLRRLGLVLFAFALSALENAATADETTAPTPRLVIYPGDVIRDDMLADAPLSGLNSGGPVAISRAQVIGLAARRTLLPGRAIPMSAIGPARAIRNGAQVKLLYVDGALTIMTFGSAMQDGAVGDLIKVRNDDSGVTVSGEVQPDGAVMVNGG